MSRRRELNCPCPGLSPAEGRNVNIAWSSSDFPLSDAEYLAAMRTIVCPIIRNFNPGIILVSAGFDATQGHPPTIGGYNVSPACFASMTSSLLQFAEGKVVLALEGGYVGPAVAESVVECLKVLLAEPSSKVSRTELDRTPLKQAAKDIEKTIANLVRQNVSETICHFTFHLQVPYWPVLSETRKYVGCSHLQYLDSHPLDITDIRNLQV